MIFNQDNSDLINAINALETSFGTVKGVSQVSDFGNRSMFFAATANITMSPSNLVLPRYSKGVFITTSIDALIFALDAEGNVYTLFRNSSYWVKPVALTKVICPVVEDALQSTHNMHIGEYCIVNGLLYRVIAEIPNGGTYTIGTNIIQTSIAEEFYRTRVIEDNGYFKLPNGTLVCYGVVSHSFTGAGTADKTVTFPVSYVIDSTFNPKVIVNVMFGNDKGSEDGWLKSVSKTGAVIALQNTYAGNNSVNAFWVSIGR